MDLCKKKLGLLLCAIVICTVFILNWLNVRLLPVVVTYGDYECENMLINVTNEIVKQLNNQIKKESIVTYDDETSSLKYNVEILNSLSVSAVSKLQYYLNKIEKGEYDDEIFKKVNLINKIDVEKRGIVYSIPTSKAFNNSVISSLFVEIPVRYRMAGKICSQIVSEISEYGINNALVEVKMKIEADFQIITPIMSDQKNIQVYVPLSMQLLEGKVPNIFYGSQVIGGTIK